MPNYLIIIYIVQNTYIFIVIVPIIFMNMVYIRSKKIKGQTYYYVVEGKLVKGKVKQKVLKYLGNVNHILEVFTEYEKKKK